MTPPQGKKKQNNRFEPYQKGGQSKKADETTPFGNPKMFWKVDPILIFRSFKHFIDESSKIWCDQLSM